MACSVGVEYRTKFNWGQSWIQHNYFGMCVGGGGTSIDLGKAVSRGEHWKHVLPPRHRGKLMGHHGDEKKEGKFELNIEDWGHSMLSLIAYRSYGAPWEGFEAPYERFWGPIQRNLGTSFRAIVFLLYKYRAPYPFGGPHTEYFVIWV